MPELLKNSSSYSRRLAEIEYIVEVPMIQFIINVPLDRFQLIIENESIRVWCAFQKHTKHIVMAVHPAAWMAGARHCRIWDARSGTLC